MKTIILWFIDKFLFPFGVNVATWYFTEKAKKTKNKHGDNHKAKVLKIISKAKIRPSSTKSSTEVALQEIILALTKYLERDNNAEKRKFRLNFLSSKNEFYTDDITIEQMLVSLKRIDLRILASIVTAVTKELTSDSAVRLISSRDALGEVFETTEELCRSSLEDSEHLHEYLSNELDREMYLRDEIPEYGGIDCPILPDSDEYKILRKIQKEMKEVGKRTTHQKCSRTHIVMSAAIGDGWINNSDSSDKYMVITAGKTDKNNLLIPSQTPIVTQQRNGNWVFYGDKSASPSSEMRSHWRMHERLCADASWANNRCIFHAHLIDVIDISKKYHDKNSFMIETETIANIDWMPHGKAKLGDKIIDGIFSFNSKMVVVKGHGPWFVCKNLPQGLEHALSMVDKIKLL